MGTLQKSAEDIQCVILAGGLGTRMATWTSQLPKSLIPVNGKPFLQYQIEYLIHQGISNVTLCTGYRSEQIDEFLKKTELGIQIHVSKDGPVALGTAGSIRLALARGFLRDQFFILFGDSYLPIDFMDVWNSFDPKQFDFLMTVFQNNDKWDQSNVVLNSKGQLRYDKSRTKFPTEDYHYIDYGLSIAKASVFEKEIFVRKFYDLSILQEKLSIQNQVQPFEVKQRFFEIGSPGGLEDFKKYRSHFV